MKVKYEKGGLSSRKFKLALFGVLLAELNLALNMIPPGTWAWLTGLLIGGYLGINVAQKIGPNIGFGNPGRSGSSPAAKPPQSGWPAGGVIKKRQ